MIAFIQTMADGQTRELTYQTSEGAEARAEIMRRAGVRFTVEMDGPNLIFSVDLGEHEPKMTDLVGADPMPTMADALATLIDEAWAEWCTIDVDTFLFRAELQGAHMLVRVWCGDDAEHRASCGALLMRVTDFILLRDLFPAPDPDSAYRLADAAKLPEEP